MPIHECDPWCQQYFAGVECPSDVHIPTDDRDAWRWNPGQRWIFNKLLVAQSQGLECAPHGLEPARYPVFSKPVFNLRGMGVGSQVLASREDYERAYAPGHMWMTLLVGEHVSTDAAVVRGRVRWSRHAVGIAAAGGTFDYWTVEAGGRAALEAYIADWISAHLADYTGMVNIESIGGRIIEAHLRFADQWPDLYGPGWLDALVGLYARGRWEHEDRGRREGFSVVLFAPSGRRYLHPPREASAEVLATPGVSSLQISFHEHKAPAAHAMPPGGFRLAVVNCFSLAAGLSARARLALSFGLEQRAKSSAAALEPGDDPRGDRVIEGQGVSGVGGLQ
jgi:hypothetical protein